MESKIEPTAEREWMIFHSAPPAISAAMVIRGILSRLLLKFPNYKILNVNQLFPDNVPLLQEFSS